ncbi:MAG: TonB-dependent receptor [Vicinamibacterales bacterium]
MRLDGFRFDVTSERPANSGVALSGIASPKASLVLGPWRRTEAYVNWGLGFHSNDARGATIALDPATGAPARRVTPVARARGAEVGIRTEPAARLATDLTLWRLDLGSEQLFVGDAGTTDAGRPSLRWGVEWNAAYGLGPWFTLDSSVAWSHARFSDGPADTRRIPGAVGRVTSLGATLDSGRRVHGSLRLRHIGPRALGEDGRTRSQSARVLNADAGVRLRAGTDLLLDVFNLLDAQTSDIDYLYTSRLSGEPLGGVEDVHTHPAVPRTIRVRLRWRW